MSANVVALIANLNQFKTAAAQPGTTLSGNEPVMCSIDVLIAALQTLDAGGGGGGTPGAPVNSVQFNSAGAFGGIANVSSDGTNIALGTPISGVATNLTGLPISSGVSGLGAGVATFLATPSSANLAAAVTGETGTGAAVFATNPVFVTPNLDTPSNLVLTNATGTPASIGLANGTGYPIIADIAFVIDGGGSVLTTGLKGYLEIPFGCTINRATLLADQTGSVVVDIFKCTFAQFDASATHPVAADKITASAPPTIAAATKAQDSVLTGWTTTINAGDILAFNVNSITTCQRVTLSLKVTKTT